MLSSHRWPGDSGLLWSLVKRSLKERKIGHRGRGITLRACLKLRGNESMHSFSHLSGLLDFGASCMTKNLARAQDDDVCICILSEPGMALSRLLITGDGGKSVAGICKFLARAHVMYSMKMSRTCSVGDIFMLSDQCKTLCSFVGSLLCKVPSANLSNFSRSLIVG